MTAPAFYALLGLLEALVVLGVVVGVLFYRLRRSRAETAALRCRLEPATPMDAATATATLSDYAGFLRQQIERSNRLLGETTEAVAGTAVATAADPQTDPHIDPETDPEVRQMLALRQQFLQVELTAQGPAAAGDTLAWRTRLVEGLNALVAGWCSPANAPEGVASAARDELTQLREQIAHLRSVIDNQHAVMRELRESLEAHGGEDEALQTMVQRLAVVGREGEALQLRLGARAREEERALRAHPDAEPLRDLVGSQQNTIQHLRQLLAQLAPAGDTAEAVQATIGTIQRTNDELNGCIAVLEDENTMLRARVEDLQVQLAGLDGQTETPPRQTAADTNDLLKTLFDQPDT